MMNGKNSIFVIALWTLLLGPTLCSLGVMVHACFGDGAADCHDEVQCSADPCEILVVPASGQSIKPDAGMDHIDHTKHFPAINNDRFAYSRHNFPHYSGFMFVIYKKANLDHYAITRFRAGVISISRASPRASIILTVR